MKKTRELVSCEDYVLNIPLDGMEVQSLMAQQTRRYQKCVSYAKFLKQPLTLGMFVPCDDEGNVLEEPINFNSYSNGLMPTLSPLYESCEQYHQALDKVLFEGFEVDETLSASIPLTVKNKDGFHVYWFDAIAQEWYLSKGIKSISDLCGYGLKYYEQ